ncbi:cell division protein FtsL [Zooshikella harenae]|uniref:Cell division protein FtsL n=1 Tax=Zooshikella harenae TaxID=2827238 RepID=A0ABS5ZA73_9GAMM|nr:cell division protein FtsL [Zooshikella harenae]MBU2710221.1 cell division protein FtsL [Zooshikella harenae]
MTHVVAQLKQKQVVVFFLLMVVIVVSSVAITYVAHMNRRAFNDLQRQLVVKNSAQVEWGQLLLQHSTLTTPKRVERIATEKLDMEAPNPDQIKMVVP